ncbi:hypothetical protein CDD82_4593 [Ophiocordyceps australis]|uniref:Uncharacterized protein n=1 Tax=Ophiocordyceps australis TaxID=1399860 RepID=A0A2C5Z535_9HYPO|nr:hypothetical protein CDD82_4593 [Ophiocordyceps australis]
MHEDEAEAGSVLGDRQRHPGPNNEEPHDLPQNFWVVLQTPFQNVFTLSSDSTYYTNPPSLRGVPVNKITQDSPYWEPSWASLDAFLADEQPEQERKDKFDRLRKLHPDNKTYRKQFKLHTDNMSKHRKIREIFGSHSNCHPNQLVSKKHLPPEGLCQMETMYLVACKISELDALHTRHELHMEPWDFVRWQIGEQLENRLIVGQRGDAIVRTVITRLWESTAKGNNPYGDTMMRQLAIRGATFQGKGGNYGSKQERKQEAARVLKHWGIDSPASHHVSRHSPPPKRRRSMAADMEQKRREALQQRRAARRAAQPPSIYQGVNAFRMEQSKRE